MVAPWNERCIVAACLLAGGCGAKPPAEPSTAMPASASAAADGDIREKVSEQLPRTSLNLCYETMIRRDPSLAGFIVLSLNVRQDGTVRSATVLRATLGDIGMIRCVREAVEKTRFSFGSRSASYVVPLTFGTENPAVAKSTASRRLRGMDPEEPLDIRPSVGVWSQARQSSQVRPSPVSVSGVVAKMPSDQIPLHPKIAMRCDAPLQACRRDCDAGAMQACVNVAVVLARGSEHSTPDPAGAADVVERACRLGSAFACTYRGVLADGEDNGMKDAKTAHAFLERGCGLGDPFACARLGEHYAAGFGVDKNPQMAVSFYERACASDDPDGCFLLGSAYAEGDGVIRDGAQAGTLYARACALGSRSACAKVEKTDAAP
jgi:hypothetical protein